MGDWAPKRLVIEVVAGLLILGGILSTFEVAALFWMNTDDHHWYMVVATVFVGLATGLAAWFLAALLSLFVEVADNIRTIAERSSAGAADTSQEPL
jgi:hypothetical protein